MTIADPSFPRFLEVSRQVSLETEQHLHGPLSFLIDIDKLFVDWLSDAGKIKTPTSSILILNAHASFRAGLTLALSGQLLPVFMALRGGIESALYANAIAYKPELADVWLKRDQDEGSRSACRNAFKISKMFDYLSNVQNTGFSDLVHEAYDATIEFGAHPNSKLILRNVSISETQDGSHAVDFAYIHGHDSSELRQSFVACAEIGCLIFLIALIASNGHPNLKVLNERTLAIQDSIPDLIKMLTPYKSNFL